MRIALFDPQWRIYYWLLLLIVKLQERSFEQNVESRIITGDDLMMMKARVGGTGKAVVQLLIPQITPMVFLYLFPSFPTRLIIKSHANICFRRPRPSNW